MEPLVTGMSGTDVRVAPIAATEPSTPPQRDTTAESRWSGAWRDGVRPLALAAVALVSAAGYAAFWPLLPAAQRGVNSQIALVMAALALPYVAACWLLLRVPAPRLRGWRRVEWGVLLGGTALFRAIVFLLPPVLSRDAYRYVWDALLTTHGFSPYLHGPNWPGYDSMRPPGFYPHVPFKPVPTIYPPGAQLLYRLAFSVAPLNVWAIKAEMVLFDLLAGALLALVLRRLGRDTRRAFIYLWAPLPVVEFAFSGHVDAAAVAYILLALVLDGLSFRGVRALIGVVLGFATLIKLYPLVLVVALVRRRDWALLGALGATLLVGYAPYIHDGMAAFGFLSTYLTELDTSYGGAVLLIRAVGFGIGLSADVVRGLGVLGATIGVGAVLWLRVRRRGARLTPLAASFALIALWLAFSPHVFPWYTAALLPYAALALELPPRVPAQALALGALTFCALMPLAYVAYERPAWYWLYPFVYVAGLVTVLAVWGWWRWGAELSALFASAGSGSRRTSASAMAGSGDARVGDARGAAAARATRMPDENELRANSAHEIAQ